MALSRQNPSSNHGGGRMLDVLLIVVAWLALITMAYAQGGTTRYVYDDNGRLRAVIAPSGEANIYEYDAAGNFTAIRRNTAGTLEVLDFTPREGAPGAQVTIIGTGFGNGVNGVAFNGTAAQLVSVNAPLVVVTVPAGATTGPISVTTPGGTAMTAQPFSVRGISVAPAAVTVQANQTIQFTATVVVTGDQNITWSVDGIEGGSAGSGTITAAGLYSAPRLLPSQPSVVFRVRATSVSEPAVYGESVVTVKNPEFIRPVFAQALSVRNGNPANGTPIYAAALTVRNGNPANGTPIYSSVVAVRNGSATNATPVYSAALTVRNGSATNATPVYGSTVTVRNGRESNAAPIYSGGVSVTAGPSIAAITPGQAARGATINITVSGANLNDASALTFFNIASGAFDSNITVSNINVNGAGTSLTATLTINGSAALGRRVVMVTASGNTSPLTDAGSNIIEIVP